MAVALEVEVGGPAALLSRVVFEAEHRAQPGAVVRATWPAQRGVSLRATRLAPPAAVLRVARLAPAGVVPSVARLAPPAAVLQVAGLAPAGVVARLAPPSAGVGKFALTQRHELRQRLQPGAYGGGDAQGVGGCPDG